MAKPATLKKPTAAPAAKGGPKLAGAAKPAAAAKPGKALAKPAKATKEAEPKFAVGNVVNFLGYKNRDADFEPLFAEGDRLVLVTKEKDPDNNTTFYAAVKEEDHAAYVEDADSVNGDQIFAAEFEKAEKLPDDPYALKVATNERLDELIAENDGDVLAAAKALQDQANEATFYLGGALAQLYIGQKFREYGDYADTTDDAGAVEKLSGWNKFTQEHFNQGGRKCVELIGTYSAIVGTGLSAEEIDDIAKDKKIGWVKLAAVKNVVTAENVGDIIDRARTQNVSDFKEGIKVDYVADSGEARSGGTGGAAKVKRTTIKATFFEDQAAGVQYVISAAAKEFGVAEDALGQVLERIIMDWGQQNLGEAQFKKARSAKRKLLKDLKAGGVDTKARLDEDAELEEFLSRGDEGGETAAA